MSFKQINDVTLNEIESLVQNGLLQILKEKCNDECDFIEKEKVNFFGSFTSNVKNFRFFPGERALILEYVEHVKRIIDAREINSNLSYFDVPKNHKMTRKDTANISVGCFFVNKIPSKKKKVLNVYSSSKELKTDLIPKLRNKFSSIDDTFLVSEIPKKSINIVNDGSRVVATVECLLCEREGKPTKKIVVQYDTSPNMKTYWNISNLNKHLKSHIIKSGVQTNISESDDTDNKKIFLGTDEVKKSDMHTDEVEKPDLHTDEVEKSDLQTQIYSSESTDLNMCLNQSQTIGLKIEPSQDKMEEDQVTFEKYENLLYKQLSEQNLKLAGSNLLHSPSTSTVKFKLADRLQALNVVQIDPDGNCLFGALCHQLFCYKVNSVAHNAAVNKLRADVVTYINEHFDDFKFILKWRISSPVNDIDKECTFFVNFCLRKNGFWGGTESIKAVSQIYKVNVIVINEEETHYFPIDFIPEYDRTIAIVYRIGIKSTKDKMNPIRNHYDSVEEIPQSILMDMIKQSAQIETIKLNEQDTIEIFETEEDLLHF